MNSWIEKVGVKRKEIRGCQKWRSRLRERMVYSGEEKQKMAQLRVHREG